MSAANITGLVTPLQGISLADLDSAAALQSRVDRKYLLTPAQLEQTLAGRLADGRVLEIHGLREMRYESLYFDTPDFLTYMDTARRRPRRFKLRVRRYLDTGAVALEVKVRGANGRTDKHRHWLDSVPSWDTLDDLDAGAEAFLSQFPRIAQVRSLLEPSLTTRYTRSTVLLGDQRVTLDSDVRGATPQGRETSLGSSIVLETKSRHHAGAVDRWLWSEGIRPTRVSKYCTMLAAVEPQLPSNRWARTLRRHVPSAPQRIVQFA